MNRWDEVFSKVHKSGLAAGNPPVPPTIPPGCPLPGRGHKSPEYLLVGQRIVGGVRWKMLLVLISRYINMMC